MPERSIRNIVSQKEICPGHYQMVIDAPEIAAEAEMGQFLHLKWAAETNSDPLLRRPISFNEIDREHGQLIIVYRVIGRGTKLLSTLEAGDKIDLMGPLGTGFSIPEEKNNFLVVGGGMGIAPLLDLVENLLVADKEVTVLLGAEKKEQLLNLEQYQELNVNLKTATMDGSSGYQGFVTDLLADLTAIEYVYTCGPEVMMATVQEWAQENEIAGQASLEERMGCGTGACLSCVCKIKVETESGWEYQKTCTTGPIFALNEVIFDE
ncbi:dihydroorotate dehydrogenase electron transfer subunit [Halanaerobacter jeridensis]|uniref:Dihydroorotate dehydrogenase B (NAD(+)), electron transfer subunit n=1 Tax=Halanaerobacter jeridensis TaxID=706427 RepID=A0A938XR16_9FIRM|nr:dihydroorotate dehydrogenase electron transfer subunit [Halanaerobacter jeridensis]MBM7556036.1 dihydroorotate dehydrogenase electron transfer subunit [Halanaerobacter jeridensis]